LSDFTPRKIAREQILGVQSPLYWRKWKLENLRRLTPDHPQDLIVVAITIRDTITEDITIVGTEKIKEKFMVMERKKADTNVRDLMTIGTVITMTTGMGVTTVITFRKGKKRMVELSH
jgi:hypothetical protein